MESGIGWNFRGSEVGAKSEFYVNSIYKPYIECSHCNLERVF